MDTNVTDLSPLRNCSQLKSLQLNNSDINLYSYTDIINEMCKRGWALEAHWKCGILSFGGLSAPVKILNTLNGTESKPNSGLEYFHSYGCVIREKNNVVDFSNTGLKYINRACYNEFTLKLPSCFEEFRGETCTFMTIDYSNINVSELYNSRVCNSVNTQNFNGYKTVRWKRKSVIF